MKNKFFGIVILLILIINFNFILAEESGEEFFSFSPEKVTSYTESSYDEEITTLSFVGEGGSAEIKGVKFENIAPTGESLSQSYIKIDAQGNILEADLTANEKGSIFLINGLTFQAPPNSRVYYKSGQFFLNDVKISEIEKDKIDESVVLEGVRINLLDELVVSDGIVYLNKDGSYELVYGDFLYKNIEINKVDNYDDLILVKDSSKDLSDYKGNFIQETAGGLKVQSVYGRNPIDLEFFEGNEIFKFTNEGLGTNEERALKMQVSQGDGIQLINQRGFFPGQIIHSSSENGVTTIENGRHIFKFEDGELITEFGNLNTKNLFSVKSSIRSDLLNEKRISVDESNGYNIFNPLGGDSFSFDKSLLADPEYNFKNKVGENFYSFAEDQIGDSAFVWGGRGEVYYDEIRGEKKQIPVPVKGYDCIGLAQCGLVAVYPGTSFKDFPPNLQLVDALENRGWKSKIIEPTSVVGEKTTQDSVKNIPPGSVVFLMHDTGPEYILVEKFKEGISYQTYTNSKNEKIYLVVGHTLIKGIGEKNFINAKPSTIEEVELPRAAEEYNKKLIKQGKDPLFNGPVKEGNMVPEDDYLIVISPPEN